jgi:transcriptional regulator with XRE-family HTH domain
MDDASARREARHMAEVQTRPKVLGMLEARKRAGIGIERCSRASGVDIRSIIRYERGRARVGIKNASRIARVLGVRVDEIAEFLPAVREVEAAGFVLPERDETKTP